jgi:MYXO-CTERM domain-containing protein
VVAIDDSIDELGPGAREAVQSAFGNWLETGAELPRLRFESTRGKKPSERPDGVNTVMFAPIDLKGHKNDVAITLTFSDPKTGEIVEADIVINSHHPFAVLGAPAGDSKPKADSDERDDHSDDDDRSRDTDQSGGGTKLAEGASARSCGPAATTGAECGKAYDLENAAAHEVGHFFGLGEDVEDTKTSMYQCISRCEVHKRTLESGDREAAVGLYLGSEAEAAAEANAGGCGGARVASSPANSGAVFPLAALVVAGLVARRRRR